MQFRILIVKIGNPDRIPSSIAQLGAFVARLDLWLGVIVRRAMEWLVNISDQMNDQSQRNRFIGYQRIILSMAANYPDASLSKR